MWAAHGTPNPSQNPHLLMRIKAGGKPTTELDESVCRLRNLKTPTSIDACLAPTDQKEEQIPKRHLEILSDTKSKGASVEGQEAPGRGGGGRNTGRPPSIYLGKGKQGDLSVVGSSYHF